MTNIADNLPIWVKHIDESTLPILRSNANEINFVASDESTSIEELANKILLDPFLVFDLLRMANNIRDYDKNFSVMSIRDAIRVLGFNKIRYISESQAYIDTHVQGCARQYVMELAVQSIHAAKQALNLYIIKEDRGSEEVFISALLYKLGELAFWAVSDKAGDYLLSEFNKSGSHILFENNTPDETSKLKQKKIIGTTFDELTLELLKEWHASEIIEKALLHQHAQDSRVKSIQFGQAVASAALNGWSSKQMQACIKHISLWLHRSEHQTEIILKQNIEEAVELMNATGIKHNLSCVQDKQKVRF